MYVLTASASGFSTFREANLRLLVNSPATVNMTLRVQGVNVEVQVTGEAPLVNTQDASLGNAFTERQLLRLPSEGRDPASILSLQPGVTFIAGTSIDQSNDSRGGSVSGARSDQTNITLDGLRTMINFSAHRSRVRRGQRLIRSRVSRDYQQWKRRRGPLIWGTGLAGHQERH